jgi:hypothetical protein
MKPRVSPLLEAIRCSDQASAWRRLVDFGQPAYRVVTTPVAQAEARGDVRRRTRLNSAKVLDSAGLFLCDALIQDRSTSGLRLLLARNLGLPTKFGVYDDSTEEILTAMAVWRRERAVGARILSSNPPAPLRPAARAALAGRYYGVRG